MEYDQSSAEWWDQQAELFPDDIEHHKKHISKELRDEIVGSHVPHNPWQIWLDKSGQIAILGWIEQEPKERTDGFVAGFLLKNGKILKQTQTYSTDGEYASDTVSTPEFMKVWKELQSYTQAGGDELAVDLMDV